MGNIGSIGRSSYAYKQRLLGKSLGVSVAVAGLTTLLEMCVEGIERVFCEVVPGANAFDAFSIEGKAHPDGSWTVLYNSGFAAPTGILLGTSGDLAALGAGTSGWFLLETKGIYALRVQASAAGGATVSNAYISGSGV